MAEAKKASVLAVAVETDVMIAKNSLKAAVDLITNPKEEVAMEVNHLALEDAQGVKEMFFFVAKTRLSFFLLLLCSCV